MKPNQLLRNVVDNLVDEDDLGSLSLLVNSPVKSREFVEALGADQLLSQGEKSAAVSRTMRVLETLADRSELIACVLMAHLWPIASELFLHDVCNSIELWINHNGSIELGRYLQMIAASQADDKVRRHFELMAINLEKEQ